MFEKINKQKEKNNEALGGVSEAPKESNETPKEPNETPEEIKKAIKLEEENLENLLAWVRVDPAPGEGRAVSALDEEIKDLKSKFISTQNIDDVPESDLNKIRVIIENDKVLSGTYSIIKRDILKETGSFPTRREAIKKLYKTLAKDAQITGTPESRYRDLQVAWYDLVEEENADGQIKLDLDSVDTNKLRELMEKEEEILDYYQKAKKILAKGVPQSLNRAEVLLKMTDLINEKIADDTKNELARKFKDILSKSKLN